MGMRRKEFLAYTAPSAVLMIGLMIAPLVLTIVLSLNQFTYGSTLHWVGLANYQQLLTTPEVWTSMLFTIMFMTVTTALKIFIGYVMASLLSFVIRMRSFFLGVMLIPLVIPPVVGALLYGWMFRRDIGVGLYDYLLQNVGIHIDWFSSKSGAFALLIGQNIWQDASFAGLILLAGLQVMPKEPVEASMVDGAGWWQRQRFIVLPSLGALFVFVAMMSIMDGFRIFDSIAVTTRGGPDSSTESLMFLTYKITFQQSQLGLGSALSLITVAGILIILIPFLHRTSREFRGLT